MTGNTDDISVGVIGVGAMGRHHARVYSEVPDARFRGVSDVDRDQAERVAAAYNCEAYELEDLLAVVDAVSIAVPTRYHRDVALKCIDAGVHVLIEKPFASDPAEGRDLIDRASRAGVTLQVGHVERFNPAVHVLNEIIDDLEVISIRADRLGPPPNRPVGDDAVLDLMIHDIDILLSLFEGFPTVIGAAGARDNTFATALLRFPSGIVGALTASRVTQLKSRQLQVTADECYVGIDYLSRSMEVHLQTAPASNVREGEGDVQNTTVVERPTIDATDPLEAELTAFLEAARSGARPKVTGEDGLRALELALQIQEGVRAKSELISQ